MADILDDLADLHRQATHEPIHYYAAKTAERAIREIKKLRAALKPFAEHSHCVDHISQSNLALWCARALLAVALDHEQKGDKS